VVITNAPRPSDKYDYYSKEPPAATPALDPLGPRRRGRRPAPRFEDHAEENGGAEPEGDAAIRSEPAEER
jgi:hypothetical protein